MAYINSFVSRFRTTPSYALILLSISLISFIINVHLIPSSGDVNVKLTIHHATDHQDLPQLAGFRSPRNTDQHKRNTQWGKKMAQEIKSKALKRQARQHIFQEVKSKARIRRTNLRKPPASMPQSPEPDSKLTTAYPHLNSMNHTPSLKILLREALDTQRPIPDDEIIPSLERERCRRYGLELPSIDDESESTPLTRRRIFAGGMLADDSLQVLAIHAIETYGIYTHVAFVESNRTHDYSPRTMKYVNTPNPSEPLQLLQGGMFGPTTRVTVDPYLVDKRGNITLPKEEFIPISGQQLQRNVALARWKKEGMTRHDLGLIMDVDEILSRDFLRALQICDIPEFRHDQSCQRPKLMGNGLAFEGSPECVFGHGLGVTNGQIWHPEIMLGECIEGIGDAVRHPPPRRKWVVFRDDGYGGLGENDYDDKPANVSYPLWNAGDFRQTSGGRQLPRQQPPLDSTRASPTDTDPIPKITQDYNSYHIHNFATDFKHTRFKYKSYGESSRTDKGWDAPLGDYDAQTRIMTNCVQQRDDSFEGVRKQRLQGGFGKLEGDIPLAFRLEGYVELRHGELKLMVEEDEARYGFLKG